MIKRNDSFYLPGRPKGPWWKWKRDPFTLDTVLMYAQRGHGKRSSFYSGYTFGVWTEGGWRRTGACRQSLFRIYGRGAFGDRSFRAAKYDRAFWSSAGGCAWRRQGTRVRSGIRGPATLDQRASRVSRCGFRASAGCAGTSRRAYTAGLKRSRQFWEDRKSACAGRGKIVPGCVRCCRESAMMLRVMVP